MTQEISNKRAVISVLLAWLVFVGIDFLFHASLFSGLWNKDLPALKSLDDLALLIPAGYMSFLFLSALVGFTFFKIFNAKPAIKDVLLFGLIFALLFSLSNLLGLYSYIELPLIQLVAFNLVYFVEILAVALCLYYFSYLVPIKKAVLSSVLVFLGLVFIGIIIQNVVLNSQP